MKNFLTILTALLTIIAGVTFTGYKVTEKNDESRRIMVLSNAKGTNSDTKAFELLEQNFSSDNEWISFRRVTELKFNEIEILIFGLKTRMDSVGEISDMNYKKKIVSLEEQVRYEKARLTTFEKNPVNWVSFKTGFLDEINAILRTAKELFPYSEKAIAETGPQVTY